MKRKRHFFDFWASLLNTILMMGCTVFFAIGVVVGACDKNIAIFIASLILLLVAFSADCLLVIYDGWKAWEVVGDCLVVTKLFRKKQSISLGQVTSIEQKHVELVCLDMSDNVDGYAFTGNGITICIPKSKESDALVDEIRQRNN